MIFNRVLKGTDLTFEIGLEKTEYRPGDIVRGTLSIRTEKGSKARKLVLFAEGKESTSITVSESTDAGSSRHTTTRTYSEINTFFSKDLSHLLQESIGDNIVQNGAIEILPQNKVIAFDFTLLPTDNNMFSSYKGEHASITYTVKATADIAKKLDVNKEEQFSVVNPNGKMAVYSSNTPFDGDNNSNTIDATIIEEKDSISQLPIIDEEKQEEGEGEEKGAGKRRYEARYEQIFGKEANRTSPQDRPPYLTLGDTGMNFDLGTIFTKGRDDFLKKSSEAKIDLVEHESNNTPYSRGEIIRGNVILLFPQNEEEEEEKREKIRGTKITLNGIEHAFAQGLDRVSTIEKYEEKIELNQNENVRNDDRNSTIIPFELEIPQDVNQSYRGKYSEYFWGLEAKVNIAWSSDINARRIIEIV